MTLSDYTDATPEANWGPVSPDGLVKGREDQLWSNFESATDAHPRGLFLRVGDAGERVRCVFKAVAMLLVPLVVEVSRLRAEVADLRGDA